MSDCVVVFTVVAESLPTDLAGSACEMKCADATHRGTIMQVERRDDKVELWVHLDTEGMTREEETLALTHQYTEVTVGAAVFAKPITTFAWIERNLA